MNKIEHVGIAVKSLKYSRELYTKLLGSAGYKEERVETEGVTTLFFNAGGNKIELLEPLDPAGPVAKFIEKRGEGIHHLAFDVDDIEAEMERLKGEGFLLVNDRPKRGADNKWVCFVHPKDTSGVLIELCQEIK